MAFAEQSSTYVAFPRRYFSEFKNSCIRGTCKLGEYLTDKPHMYNEFIRENVSVRRMGRFIKADAIKSPPNTDVGTTRLEVPDGTAGTAGRVRPPPWLDGSMTELVVRTRGSLDGIPTVVFATRS